MANTKKAHIEDSPKQQPTDGQIASFTNSLAQLYLTMTNKKNESEYEGQLTKHINKIHDAYSNSILGIGDKDKLSQFDEYSLDNSSLNMCLWLAMYNESWVFKRVIDKPSQDMIRPGISLLGTADYSKVYLAIDNLKQDLISAVKWSKLFGGSVMVLLFKGIKFEDMENPIYDSLSKIKDSSYIKSYVTDRWFGCSPSYDDTVTNISNDDFGLPKYYDIQFADGTQHHIHHSWILRFENRQAPNFIKTGMLQGWGYAEGQHLIRELNRDEKLKDSIQSLLDKALIEIIKMPGMTGVYMGAEDGNKKLLEARLNMVNWARNFNSLTFLDKDDEYEQHSFSGLSGFADFLDVNMRQIAAAVEMPNVLFGDLSNGFTSDDQALERYDEKILNDDETYLRKPMTKLIKILFKVYGIDKEKLGFTFNSIIADKRNTKKLEEINSLIDTCQKMVDSKIMTSAQEAKTIREYIDTGSVNFQFANYNEESLTRANRKNEEENGSPAPSDRLGGFGDYGRSEPNDFGEDNDSGDFNMGSSIMKRSNTQNEQEPTEQNEQPDKTELKAPEAE